MRFGECLIEFLKLFLNEIGDYVPDLFRINVRTLVAKSSLMYTWYTHLAYCNNESRRDR